MNELASRRSNGRFAKGNPDGPGNPFARRVARLRTLIQEAVTDEDLKAIVQKMVQRAKQGDMVATRELLTRLVGRPPDALDPDKLDLEEIKLRMDTAEVEEDQAWQESCQDLG